jgi:hypothetical protein
MDLQHRHNTGFQIVGLWSLGRKKTWGHGGPPV